MLEQSKARILIHWCILNGGSFLVAFICVGILSLISPDFMLNLFGKWAQLLANFGAKVAGEFTSSYQVFLHILQRNTIAAFIYLIIGFLLQAPLAMLFGGAFYAFVAFLAPYTIGSPFSVYDWLLVLVEASSLILAASLSSAVAGSMYQVQPSLKKWWFYSKSSWRSFSMKPINSWRDIFPQWYKIIWPGLVGVGILILITAWFEVYGY